MKKSFLILTICLFFALPSQAGITPEEATSEEYIQNHGYCDEMSRLIDLQKSQINGTKPQYVSHEPSWYTANKPFRYIRNIFSYFDTGLDDGRFMSGDEIHYTNKWNDL